MTRKEPEVKEFVPCTICGKETEDANVCEHCSQIVCVTCKPTHRYADETSVETETETIQGEKIKDDNEDDGCSDTEESKDQASFQFHLILSQAMKSQYNVVHDSSFVLPSNFDVFTSLETSIRCLVPKTKDLSFVLSIGRPDILLLNKSGDIVERIKLFNSIGCFAITKEDNILLTVKSHRLILRYNGERCVKVTNTGNFEPLFLSLFSDERIAVTGVSYLDENHLKINEPETFGALQIYSPKWILLKEIVSGNEGNLFEFPADVAVSPLNNMICVSDRKKEMVALLSEDGDLLRTYKGNPLSYVFFTKVQNNGRRFIPLGMAFDSNGYLFLINSVDCTIHILQPNGNFCGYMLTKSAERFGNPYSIAISKDDQIWLGDHNDEKIRVYKISSYGNYFNDF